MGADNSPCTRTGAIVQLLATAVLSAVLLLSLARYISDPRDSTRCEGMLTDGWWTGDNYTGWQPSGCMPHEYNAREMAHCLNHSRVLYVGDSIMREQFMAMKAFIPDMEVVDGGANKHSDRTYASKKHGVTIELWWDPYLNQTRTQKMLNATRLDGSARPSLLVIGSGPWYMKNLGERYYDDWKVAVDGVLDAVQQSRQVADAVMLSPVEIPQYNLLNEERGKTITAPKIARMNDYLRKRERTLVTKTPFVVAHAWNAIAASTVNKTEDGLHYLPAVTSVQASLALNYRCNNELPKHAPFDTTCCIRYPAPAWLQTALLALFLVWVPVAYCVLRSRRVAASAVGRTLLPSRDLLLSAFVFGLGIVYMYVGDRTHLFGKALKLFDASVFTWLLLIALAGGILSLRTRHDGDQGFLNRAQTDEWKGWMQIIILVYHFLGASSIPGIYNVMRVLVAAYLFQTGYGHFCFFYKKADFGLARVLNVLVRLNLLTVVLEYTMDTDYLSYYFTPLVTFWFGVIWTTMYVGHRHNASKPWFVLVKMACMAALTGLLIHADGVLEGAFAVFEVLFNTHWDVDGWRFRLALDAWIVYIGMLFAYATLQFSDRIDALRQQQQRAWLLVKAASVVASLAALTWYLYFERSLPSKQAYTAYHPLLSWIPIIAFVILRNATVRLRNTTSGLFELVGRCSLETFIGQFHMWLAADTKGLLLVLPDPAWTRHGSLGWWLNLAVSSVVFMLVCHHLNRTTGDITKWICASPPASSAGQSCPSTDHPQHVPLLPTTAAPATPNDDDDDDDDSDSDNDGAWQQEKPASRWTLLRQDLRVRAACILVSLAVLNHLY